MMNMLKTACSTASIICACLQVDHEFGISGQQGIKSTIDLFFFLAAESEVVG
jgi:hypothetical protein